MAVVMVMWSVEMVKGSWSIIARARGDYDVLDDGRLLGWR